MQILFYLRGCCNKTHYIGVSRDDLHGISLYVHETFPIAESVFSSFSYPHYCNNTICNKHTYIRFFLLRIDNIHSLCPFYFFPTLNQLDNDICFVHDSILNFESFLEQCLNSSGMEDVHCLSGYIMCFLYLDLL